MSKLISTCISFYITNSHGEGPYWVLFGPYPMGPLVLLQKWIITQIRNSSCPPHFGCFNQSTNKYTNLRAWALCSQESCMFKSQTSFLIVLLRIYHSLFCSSVLFKSFCFPLWLSSFWHFSAGLRWALYKGNSLHSFIVRDLYNLNRQPLPAPIFLLWEVPKLGTPRLFLMILLQAVTFNQIPF